MSAILSVPPASAKPQNAIADFYHKNGYYCAPGFITGPDLEALQRDFDRIVGQLEDSREEINARWNHDTTTAIDNDRSTVVIHTHEVQKYSSAYARFLFEARFLDVCEAIVGPDLVLNHTKLFLKPAGRGAPFPPHQDYGYFRTEVDTMFAGVLYLSDADESNGCLRIWPGSHRLGPIDPLISMGGDAGFAARFPFADSLPIEAKAGDMVFFSYFTVHGSLANRSDRPRKSVLFQLHGGHDRVAAGGQHIDSQLVLRGWNHRMTRTRANGR